MEEKTYYLSLKLHKWSDLELSDLFSRIHMPLNNVGKSIGFLMAYDNIDDAIDDDEKIENLLAFVLKNNLTNNMD